MVAVVPPVLLTAAASSGTVHCPPIAVDREAARRGMAFSSAVAKRSSSLALSSLVVGAVSLALSGLLSVAVCAAVPPAATAVAPELLARPRHLRPLLAVRLPLLAGLGVGVVAIAEPDARPRGVAPLLFPPLDARLPLLLLLGVAIGLFGLVS